MKKGSFTSEDVRIYIKRKLSVLIPVHQIRRNLKTNEHLSFKKGSLRPLSLDSKKLELRKQLFWVLLAHRLSEIKIQINIDESSFSRDTKRDYSWLMKGKSLSITNIVFRGSINVISWITNLGDTINLFKYTRSNAKNSLKFLKDIWNYFKEQGVNENEIGIILYNWAIHWANIVKDYWITKGVKIYYLPVYFPERVPVELYFSHLKSKLTKKIQKSEVDLKSNEFRDIVDNYIHSALRESIKKLWSSFFLTVQNELDKTKIHFTI